jgi:hypothetical protein
MLMPAYTAMLSGNGVAPESVVTPSERRMSKDSGADALTDAQRAGYQIERAVTDAVAK